MSVSTACSADTSVSMFSITAASCASSSESCDNKNQRPPPIRARISRAPSCRGFFISGLNGCSPLPPLLVSAIRSITEGVMINVESSGRSGSFSSPDDAKNVASSSTEGRFSGSFSKHLFIAL